MRKGRVRRLEGWRVGKEDRIKEEKEQRRETKKWRRQGGWNREKGREEV